MNSEKGTLEGKQCQNKAYDKHYYPDNHYYSNNCNRINQARNSEKRALEGNQPLKKVSDHHHHYDQPYYSEGNSPKGFWPNPDEEFFYKKQTPPGKYQGKENPGADLIFTMTLVMKP